MFKNFRNSLNSLEYQYSVHNSLLHLHSNFFQEAIITEHSLKKNYTWQKELRSHWSNNLEPSSGRSATPLAVTVVIWTKTETVFLFEP